MKKKTITVLLLCVLVLTSCQSANQVESSATELTETISEQVEAEEPDTTEEDVISGTIEVPVENSEQTEELTTEEADGMITTKADDMVFRSTISDTEAVVFIPEGYEVNYSDETVVEIVKPFSEDVDFDYYDEENNITYFDEVLISNFNNVRNTPYCDERDYIKAQIMNTGYNYVYDLTIGERDFIVSYAEINREDNDELLDCFPKTSIIFLYICNDNAICTIEGCTHTEVVEVYAYVYDVLDEQGVKEYVTNVVNMCSFDTVKG